MSKDKSDFDDDIILNIDDVVQEEVSNSKLSGMDDIDSSGDDGQPAPKAAKPKKKNKIALIAGSTVAALVVAAGAFVFVDMQKQQSRQAAEFQNNDYAEQQLFGEATQEPELTPNGSWLETAEQPSAQETWQQDTSSEQFASLTPETDLQQPQAAQVQTMQPESVNAQMVQSAPQQSNDSIARLESQIAGLYALVNDANKRTDEANKQLQELTAKMETTKTSGGASDPDDFITKKTYMDALRSIRALQATTERQKSALAAIEANLGMTTTDEPKKTASTQKVPSNTQPKTPAASMNTNEQASLSQAPANAAVVPDQTRKMARELAWSSYVENYGVAVIEGTADLVELKPGDLIIGRGVIDKISSYGCISFTNGGSYAPTNGSCQ